MNVELEVGDKLNSLLQQLASQIGTTVDKIYPWYVQQVYLEGMLFLIFSSLSLVVLLSAIKITHKRWDNRNFNIPTLICMIAICLTVLNIMVIFMGSPEAIMKMTNPNYYAIQKLTKNMGQLTRGR